MRPHRAAWIAAIMAAAVLAIVLGVRMRRATTDRSSPERESAAGDCTPALSGPQRQVRVASPASVGHLPAAPSAHESLSASPAASSHTDPVVVREIAREQIIADQTEVARLDLEIAMSKAKGEPNRVDELQEARRKLAERIASLRADAGLTADEDDSE
jgi:hypothetical protein